MGLRGPAPKPTALRLLEGNLGKRPINAQEPRPDIRMPQRPAWLDAGAQSVWRRLAPKLLELGVLSEVDGDIFGAYCQTASDLRRIRRLIASAEKKAARAVAEKLKDLAPDDPKRLDYDTAADTAMFAKVGDGSTLFTKQDQCIQRLTTLAREFGLTASARSRIQTTAKEQSVDPLESALCG